MSVLWMDDPSFYATAQLTQRYNSVAAQVQVGSGTGRFGGNSFHLNNGSSNQDIFRNLASSIATGTLGVSFKQTASQSSNIPLLGVYDSGTLQCDVRITSTGALIVTRNGTQIGSTSTNTLLNNVWYRIEFQVTISPTVGIIEVRVNGTSTGWIPQTTGLNTRNTANSTFNSFSFMNSGNGINGTWDMNDIVCTDSNSPNAGFLGDKRCFLLQPSGNSSVTWTPTFASWTASTAFVVGQQIKDSNGNVQRVTVGGTSKSGSPPTWATTGGVTTTDNTVTWVVVGTGANPGATNWMAVSETPTDGDNSYNADSNPGDIDLFTHPNLPAGAQNIAAVDNVVYARKDDAGTRTIQSWISSSGVTQGSANFALSTTYSFADLVQETDPNTSAAWTTSGINALLVGYKEIA